MSNDSPISNFDLRPQKNPSRDEKANPSLDDKAIEIATNFVYDELSEKLGIHDPLIKAAKENQYNEHEFPTRDVFDYNVRNAITMRLMQINDERLLTEMDEALHKARLKVLGGEEMITATLYQKLIQDPEFLTDLNKDNMWEKFVEARRCYRLAHKLPDDNLHIFDTPIREIPKPKVSESVSHQPEFEDLGPICVSTADDPYKDVIIDEIPEDPSNYAFHEIPKRLYLEEHKAFTNKYGCRDLGHNGSQRPYDHNFNLCDRDYQHNLVKCDRRFFKKYQKYINRKREERKRRPLPWEYAI
uniref:Uncharacterized protein n=1 Tax=Panagrellus redivivus TaxID=6233 RepID=A0A7E4VXI6_PANRE